MSCAIAVALHDVEPATFERCARIGDRLDDHGVEKVTLLVIPAGDLHPLDDRCPELAHGCPRAGARGRDAQHGFHHRAAAGGVAAARDACRVRGPRRGRTRARVAAGRGVLHLAGIQPRGFVAPAYAYTAGLGDPLAPSFDWWARLGELPSRRRQRDARPGLPQRAGHAGPPRSAPGPLLRLDLHPADPDHPRHVRAIERLLLASRAHARGRHLRRRSATLTAARVSG